ncbi:DUF1822 family protein [Aetokthonos hydrillicola Thurmond2011]|jgi:hypothetical protein|uniref:DUF1822 family protein n=1 Tax=Aetokthonos hydrillicola Thurmond2011 TaxID=2712845 RepID=A0AAP5I3B6_9CYAN|nr:DUF1822 family protein [Aetokthonos hydrillicola]MBO3458271.1 DUF1822 family protein [Aetokthonos hydrillicola CCALA 1050]MBW4586733.1 DUF1822 family protein [Aetokthonos hydrillicola CCALA 1050]MDR9893941.1 DUF1822 family protein [Aetokthonos hydrillicola Thurmond2011]
MSNILEALTTLYPDQICLELSTEQMEQTIASEQKYSYDVARSIASNNRLALDGFLNWFKTESGVENEQPEVWPTQEALSPIWDVVNGTAIQLGKTRIVLIPSDEIDITEFSVPAEWIDIPSWAADYYLAVQVNIEDCWIRIWGYTTHKKLKQQGQYDKIRRIYSLKQESLIEDLNVMWVARSLGGDCKLAINPLPSLSSTQAEDLLAQLSEKSLYSPRLKVDFEQWAALIENEKWRQQLYNLRTQSVLVSLSQWFKNQFEEGWLAIENILAPKEMIAVRGTRSVNRGQENPSGSEDAIATIIPLLQPDKDELIRKQAAGVLGRIGVGHPKVSKALTELLHTARDTDTRWQAAISLSKVDPDNPKAGRERGKLVDLGMQLKGHEVALIVAIMPKNDQTTGVFIKVKPRNEQALLPPHLQLTVVPELGEPGKAEARSDPQGNAKDKLIQLCFSGLPGERFQVTVIFNDVNFTENFVI